MYGFISAFVGILVGLPITVVAVAGAVGSTALAASSAETSLGTAASLGLPAALLGVGAIVVLPLGYGIVGFVVGFFHALVYNFVAGFAGGLTIETD